jgi:endonuclease G
MKKILGIILLGLSLVANAQQLPPKDLSTCLVQIPYGQPKSKKQNTSLICRRAYLLEHDNNAKIPKWVSYTLTPERAVGCAVRSDSFAADQSLPAGQRAELKDYAKSGYDTGHIANSSDMLWDITAERESFILSNMTPQLPGFNRGIWKKLEDQTRAWASDRKNTLLIYAGPIYSKQDQMIGKNSVIVPHAFFKIIIDTKTRETLVFRFDHEPSTAKLDTFLTSLAQVQKETSVMFPVPKNAVYSASIWESKSKNVSKAKRNVC